jgi:hypothetical protein
MSYYTTYLNIKPDEFLISNDKNYSKWTVRIKQNSKGKYYISNVYNKAFEEYFDYEDSDYNSNHEDWGACQNQSDLGDKSGLRALLTIVKDIQGICQITLGDEFQTRNPLIVELNKKYNEYRALS